MAGIRPLQRGTMTRQVNNARPSEEVRTYTTHDPYHWDRLHRCPPALSTAGTGILRLHLHLHLQLDLDLELPAPSRPCTDKMSQLPVLAPEVCLRSVPLN